MIYNIWTIMYNIYIISINFFNNRLVNINYKKILNNNKIKYYSLKKKKDMINCIFVFCVVI